MLIVTKLSRLRFAKQKCKRLDQNLIEPFFRKIKWTADYTGDLATLRRARIATRSVAGGSLREIFL
jgi:ribosomal protein L24E